MRMLRWQKEHNYQHGKVVTKYPDDIDIFNKMLYCEPPKMNLVYKGKDHFIDVDKFVDEVAERLQDMGATISKKIESPFSNFFKKIRK